MGRIVAEILALVLGLSLAPGQEAQDKPAAPAEQFKALVKEFYEAANLHFKATTDEDRSKVLARVDKLSPRLLELAEKNPGDPIAIDALVQAVNQEIWFESNTTNPGNS